MEIFDKKNGKFVRKYIIIKNFELRIL